MNRQEVNVASKCDYKSLCEVQAGLRIYHRYIRLGISADEPLQVYKTASGSTKYFTSKNMANILQCTAIAAHDLTDTEEISRYASHFCMFGPPPYSTALGVQVRIFKFVSAGKAKYFSRISTIHMILQINMQLHSHTFLAI